MEPTLGVMHTSLYYQTKTVCAKSSSSAVQYTHLLQESRSTKQLAMCMYGGQIHSSARGDTCSNLRLVADLTVNSMNN